MPDSAEPLLGRLARGCPCRLDQLLPFAANSVSAVSLIFLNKHLMHEYAFHNIGLLAFLHMTVTALLAAAQAGAEKAGASLQQLTHFEQTLFMVFTVLSMLSMNLSLLFNSVGFYQIAKLAMIPACCAFEYVVFGTKVGAYPGLAIVVTMAGVAIAVVSNVTLSGAGFLMAFLGVVTSAAHNVGVAYVSRKYAMSASVFMRETAPLQALSIGLVAPFLDRGLTGRWLWASDGGGGSFAVFSGCAQLVAFSCVLAAVVNLSLVGCINAFTATGAQVLGHTKTCAVLVLGWSAQSAQHAAVGAPAEHRVSLRRQYVGGAMALAGVVAYSALTARKVPAIAPAAAAAAAAAAPAPPAPDAVGAAAKDAAVEVAAQAGGGGDGDLERGGGGCRDRGAQGTAPADDPTGGAGGEPDAALFAAPAAGREPPPLLSPPRHQRDMT